MECYTACRFGWGRANAWSPISLLNEVNIFALNLNVFFRRHHCWEEEVNSGRLSKGPASSSHLNLWAYHCDNLRLLSFILSFNCDSPCPLLRLNYLMATDDLIIYCVWNERVMLPAVWRRCPELMTPYDCCACSTSIVFIVVGLSWFVFCRSGQMSLAVESKASCWWQGLQTRDALQPAQPGQVRAS